MGKDRRIKKQSKRYGAPFLLAVAGLLALTLVLAACDRQDNGNPPVPYGVVVRPTPGGTLVPLPTTGLVPQAALQATPPPAPSPGPSAVPSPTPPGQQGGNAQPSGQSQPGAATQSPTTGASPSPQATQGG